MNMEKTERNDGYSHVLKYTGVFGGVQGIGILVGIVRNKLVAMILGPEGMGLISLFNSTIKLVSDSTNFGISMSAVRDISEAYQTGDESRVLHCVKLIRSWSLLTALVGVFFCIVLSPLLNKWTFTWGNHTLHFILLSPIVGLMAITGGEMAILKGIRQLRHLAAISIYNVIAALFVSIPLYFFFHEAAIIPSLLIMALIQLLLTLGYSYRLYPLSITFNKPLLGEGMNMVKLGIAFVIAGILGSGADFIIRTYLNNVSTLETVGLYNAGYMLTMTYAATVFSAMETDFFPRLSAVNELGFTLNQTVNRQIEVSLLLASPLLVFLIIFIPILLPLLYSGKFLPVMGMVQVTSLAMYLRAIKLPIEYIPLAKGDSRSYLFLESVYDVVLVILLIVGYNYFGLLGTGIAITCASIIDFIIVLIYAHIKYGYHLSKNVRSCILYQLPLGLFAYVVTFIHGGWIYWLLGIVIIIISSYISINILRRKTHLWSSLVTHIKNKLHHD
jgi:O-antigen/teichoic acid export membrane protein